MRLAERSAGGPCGPTGATRGGWGSGGGGFVRIGGHGTGPIALEAKP